MSPFYQGLDHGHAGLGVNRGRSRYITGSRGDLQLHFTRFFSASTHMSLNTLSISAFPGASFPRGLRFHTVKHQGDTMSVNINVLIDACAQQEHYKSVRSVGNGRGILRLRHDGSPTTKGSIVEGASEDPLAIKSHPSNAIEDINNRKVVS